MHGDTSILPRQQIEIRSPVEATIESIRMQLDLPNPKRTIPAGVKCRVSFL